MCLTPDRPDSGAGCMARAVVMAAGSATPYPVDTPSPHLDSALELLEHVGGTQLSLPSINRQLRKVIDRTVEQ